MSTYKEIKGFKVQTLSTDTAASVAATGSWSAGGAMNTARFLTGGAGSSNSAALAFGGRTPSPADVALTENYNGTAWTEVGDLPAAKSYAAGAGTSTAALSIGGSSPAVPATSGKTESWNGSSWTEITALGRGPTSPQSTTYGSGSGSTTSALFYASDEGGNANARTESWNGSSWTEVADQNTARSYGAGVGTSNSSALLAGGLIYPPASANTEIWNGSAWTEVGDQNQGRLLYNTSSGQGSTTLALIYSGRLYPPNASSALTESWDGTSWTEVNDLSTARRAGSGGGTSTSAILGGGSTSGSSPGHVATTEEWATTPAADFTKQNLGQVYYNSGSNAFKVTAQPVAGGTWASATSLNSARAYIGSAGLKTAFLAFGGNGHVAVTESYNGSSWTEVNDLNTGRFAGASGGSQTAAFMAGGRVSTTASTVVSEEWNGSSWAEGNDLNLDRYAITTGMGTQTAGLAVSGNKRFSPSASPAYFAGTEQYNGTSWTEVNDLPTAMESAGGIGTQTAAGQWGGYNGSYINSGFLYDGTSWTTTTNFPISGGNFSTSGTTTAGLMFGIFDNGPGVGVANNLSWDGTSFTEVADLGTARNAGGGPTASLGTTSSAILAGGYSTTYVANTEEWTVDASNKTITVD